MSIPNSNTRRNSIDLTGRVFGRWTVIRYHGKKIYPSGSMLLWLVKCDCGTEKVRAGNTLGKGSQSCGCLHKERVRARFLRHGGTVNDKPIPEYVVWQHMKARCRKSQHPSYSSYGGRGIAVCERWLEFKNFLDDVGTRPTASHSIDRKDNDGNYSCGHCDECIKRGWPMNCRWATSSEQGLNKRDNRMLTHKGRTMPLTQWARELGWISPHTLSTRIERGWSTEEALTTPLASKTGWPRRVKTSNEETAPQTQSAP